MTNVFIFSLSLQHKYEEKNYGSNKKKVGLPGVITLGNIENG